jgi:hypothetical protein
MVAQHEWRRRVMPSCIEQARNAIRQLQDQGLHDVLSAELEGRTWLILNLRLEGAVDPDAVAAKALDAVWPAWRDCLG